MQNLVSTKSDLLFFHQNLRYKVLSSQWHYGIFAVFYRAPSTCIFPHNSVLLTPICYLEKENVQSTFVGISCYRSPWFTIVSRGHGMSLYCSELRELLYLHHWIINTDNKKTKQKTKLGTEINNYDIIP